MGALVIENSRFKKTTVTAWSPRFARPGDSWWSIVHKFAAFNGLRGPVTRELLGLECNSTKCASDDSDITDRSPHLLLEPSEARVRASATFVPQMILDEFGKEQLFHPDLRFCEACLAVGFHSPVYQIRYVQRCPIHDVALRSRCPSCHRKVPMSCSNQALAHAYACQCGHSFLMDIAKSGMRALIGELDTSPIIAWQEWARSWGNNWLFKEFASSPTKGMPLLGAQGARAAFNALWSVRPPRHWTTDAVDFESAPPCHETALPQSRLLSELDPSTSRVEQLFPVVQKHARHIIRTTMKDIEASNPDCISERRTHSPTAELAAAWKRYWTPSKEMPADCAMNQPFFSKPHLALLSRLDWVLGTAGQKNPQLAKLSPSWAKELLATTMHTALVLQLQLAIERQQLIDYQRPTHPAGSLRDSAIRMLVDTDDRRLRIWAPSVFESYVALSSLLRGANCDA